MNTEEQWLSIPDAAKLGPLNAHCLRRMRDAGTLPCIKIGKKTLVNYPALIELLSSLCLEDNNNVLGVEK